MKLATFVSLSAVLLTSPAFADTANGLEFTHYNCSFYSIPLYADNLSPFPASQNSYPGEYFSKLEARDRSYVERSVWSGSSLFWQWKVQDAQGRNAWIASSALCPL